MRFASYFFFGMGRSIPLYLFLRGKVRRFIYSPREIKSV